jgi:hypothetical protein
MGTIFGTHPLRWNNFSLEFKLISWETIYFVLINAVQLYFTFGFTYRGIQVCKYTVQQKESFLTLKFAGSFGTASDESPFTKLIFGWPLF